MKCRLCKSEDGFEYSEYGVTITYHIGSDGHGEDISIGEPKQHAVYCKCSSCGKRHRISDVRR
jgi:hypothetical protein